MSKRTVFGRLRFWDGKDDYKIEMRADALWIRKRHNRKEWSVPFTWLLRFCHQQLEIFNEGMDKSNSGKPVPGVSKTIVVSDWGNAGSLHEGPKPELQNAEERRDGVVPPERCDHKFIGTSHRIKCGWTPPTFSQLPTADVSVETENQSGTAGSPGENTGSGGMDTK